MRTDQSDLSFLLETDLLYLVILLESTEGEVCKAAAALRRLPYSSIYRLIIITSYSKTISFKDLEVGSCDGMEFSV